LPRSMLRYRSKHYTLRQRGFTLVELLIAMVILGVVSTALYTFFLTSFNQYFALQQEGMVTSELAQQSQRMAMVLRGVTDINAVSATDLRARAYFSPSDAYPSEIYYYKSADGSKLMADVTPMSDNPPTGILLTAQKRTYTVIDDFFTQPSVDLFEYLDSAGNKFTLPITDLNTIKGIRVNLASSVKSPIANGNDAMTIQVSLRNRKTNL
jgi:prepilin-type N-terminal cleavage/methylation domain-containing protein